jgi:hypothetical protein
MTPLEALSRLSGACAQDPHLAPTDLHLCADCRQRVLDALADLFVPLREAHRQERGKVYGFTWSLGPVSACALHPYLYPEVPHANNGQEE